MATPTTNLAQAAKQIQARKKQQPPRAERAQKATLNADQSNKADTQSIGMAIRKTPPIDTMLKRGQITQDEHAALKYYGDTATNAERSPVKSNLDRSVSGTEGQGPSLAITSAKIELSRLDRIIGNLRGICIAICRDYQSTAQYACDVHGARERIKEGKVVGLVPRGKDRGKVQIDFAKWELKLAATRMIKAGIGG